MIKALVIALNLINGSAEALEPGVYTLMFRSSHDVIQAQEIEISNIRRRSSGYGSFDVKVSTTGGAMRFPEDGQLVQGLYYDGKFTFILPFANIVDVTGYKFIGEDAEAAENYKGKVHIIGQSERMAKEGPFAFSMKKGTDPEIQKHRDAKAARKNNAR